MVTINEIEKTLSRRGQNTCLNLHKKTKIMQELQR
jgi:hypothetical protein